MMYVLVPMDGPETVTTMRCQGHLIYLNRIDKILMNNYTDCCYKRLVIMRVYTAITSNVATILFRYTVYPK